MIAVHRVKGAHVRDHEDSLIPTIHHLLHAYMNGDRGSFESLVCDDCIIADEGKLRDKAQEMEYVRPPLPGVSVGMSFTPAVTLVHAEHAIVSGQLHECIRTAKDTQESDFLVTDVFLWTNAKWKLLSRHQTRMTPTKKAVEVRSTTLEKYCGVYEFSPGIEISVSLTGDQLIAITPGGKTQLLVPHSDFEFSATDFDAQLLFVPLRDGATATLVLRQANQTMFAHKTS